MFLFNDFGHRRRGVLLIVLVPVVVSAAPMVQIPVFYGIRGDRIHIFAVGLVHQVNEDAFA
jgi:hypothetical protein